MHLCGQSMTRSYKFLYILYSSIRRRLDMEIGHNYDRFRKEVHPALISKIEEFSLLGYGTISQESLWEFLRKKKWRKPKEDVKVYEVVSDILSVNVGEYMNYATVEAFKSDEFSLANDEERRELLK